MFTLQTTYTPTLGKSPELQPLAIEYAATRQAQGIRTTLTTRLFNPAGPTLQLGLTFADLAAFGQYRKSLATDPAFQAFQQKLNPLLSRPPQVELFEVVVPGQGQAITPGMYYEANIWTPAFSKGPELQQALEERVKALQAQGQRATLRSQLFNPTGPAFVIILGFADLGVYEQFRKARPTDPSLQALLAKTQAGALISRPTEQRLVEALIAVPAPA